MSKVQTPPVRIHMGDGLYLEHSDPARAYAAARQMGDVMKQPDAKPFEDAGTSAQSVRANTWSDKLRSLYLDHVAPLLGVDIDQLNALGDHGYSVAMMPLAPSAPAKKLIEDGIASQTTHAFRPPRGSFINSLLLDEGGNFLNIEDGLIHADAMAHLEPDLWNVDKETGKVPYQPAADERISMGASLAKNKMIRLQFPKAGDIAVEAHHPPTPHQIDALANMFDANPRTSVSYDFTHGAVNKFKNRVTPSDLIDQIFSLYHTR